MLTGDKITPVRSPEAVPGLRVRLAEAKDASDLVDMLCSESLSSTADFAKAVQRCGELRDYSALHAVLRLQVDRQVPYSTETYGIVFTALARTAAGPDGRNSSVEAREVAGKHGKALWQHVKEHGIMLNAPELGGALKICLSSADAEWARDVWAEVVRLKHDRSPRLSSQYLTVLAHHGGSSGWETVMTWIEQLRSLSINVHGALVVGLLNAASMQHLCSYADHVWDSVAPLVKDKNEIMYACRIKSLLLCHQASKVPGLRLEMQSHGVIPGYRTLKNIVQAHLLLLHADPQQTLHAVNLKAAADAAEQLQHQVVSRNERTELRMMMGKCDLLLSGANLQLADVRVERWPWR